MSENIKIEVVSRDGRSLGHYEIGRSATFEQFKKLYQKDNKRHPNPNRQWWTIDTLGKDGKPMVVKDNAQLISAIPFNGPAKLIYKDLGPQVPWRLVFLTEYFGPGLFHSLVFWFPQLWYSAEDVKSNPEHHQYQKIAYACVMLHYFKRLFESVFVHRFSNPTMPLMNIFKNSMHYWMLGGLFIAYYVYHPKYTPTGLGDTAVYILAAIFVVAEYGNLDAHLILRRLRPEGTKTRGIPLGGLFGLVTCANYSYELLAWLVFAIFTQTFTSWLFFLVSAFQIAEWSVKKHKALKEEFGHTGLLPKGRKMLVPFIF